MKRIWFCAALAGVLAALPGCRKPAKAPDEQQIRRLVKNLTADDMVRRHEATTAVVAAGTAAVPALSEALKNSDPFMRKASASCLGLIRPARAEAVAALAGALQDSEAMVRRGAARALAEIGAAAKSSVPGLMHCLKDADPSVRTAAAEALGQIGPPAKDAVGALGEVQNDPAQSQDVRTAAGEALKKIQQ